MSDSGSALGSRFAGAGGRTAAAGSFAARPSRTANLWKPRTATTVRAAEPALSGGWSASPSRRAMRKPPTDASVIASTDSTPTPARKPT